MTEYDDLEVHLATCPDCATDLARYRELMTAMSSLRGEVLDAPAGFAERTMTRLSRPELKVRGEIRRLAHDRRARVAAVSVGGALLGAGAIGLLWWRAGRRASVRVA